MKTLPRFVYPLLMACIWLPMQARAALFEDDEARRSILDLRARVTDVQNAKADKTSVLDLANQNELLRQEVAKLRGQLEVLSNELANVQRTQKEFYTDLDGRLQKFEPQKVTVDGKDATVQPNEQKEFEAAEAFFQSANYKKAVSSYTSFLQRHPQSGYAVLAQYGLGNAYYLLGDYKNAFNAQNALIKKYPDSQKIPDAMLNMASSQLGLKNKTAAKKTLETLVQKYPESPAAASAKQRIEQIK